MLREYFKVFHLFFLFLWLGTLLTMTLLMSLKPRTKSGDKPLHASIAKSLYFRVELPSMLLAILFGILLVVTYPEILKKAYFHLKLTAVFLLLINDLFFKWLLWTKKKELHIDRSLYYLALFASEVVILLITIASIYVFKNYF